jgi:hypothetical protein
MAKGKSVGLDWLISARGYAMLCIYVGHVMLGYYGHGLKGGVEIGRFLQVGVIPFYIVLVGAFYQKQQLSFFSKLWFKFCQRIVPVYFFTALVIPFIVIFSETSFYTSVLRWLPYYLLGIPLISWPTWFLIALFTSELFYARILSWFKKPAALVVGFVIFYSLGWLLNDYKLSQPPWVESILLLGMFQAVPVFIAFMLLGAGLKKTILQMSRWSTGKVWLMLIAAYIPTLLAVSMNIEFADNEGKGLRQYLADDMPLMFIGQYGHYLWFLVSSVFGVFGFLALSRLLPSFRLFKEIGEHSLAIFCLNSIFHQVLNLKVAGWLRLPEDLWYWHLSYGVVFGLLQIILALLLAKWLNHYLPQLIGKPMLSGPILPALYRKKS